MLIKILTILILLAIFICLLVFTSLPRREEDVAETDESDSDLPPRAVLTQMFQKWVPGRKKFGLDPDTVVYRWYGEFGPPKKGMVRVSLSPHEGPSFEIPLDILKLEDPQDWV